MRRVLLTSLMLALGLSGPGCKKANDPMPAPSTPAATKQEQPGTTAKATAQPSAIAGGKTPDTDDADIGELCKRAEKNLRGLMTDMLSDVPEAMRAQTRKDMEANLGSGFRERCATQSKREVDCIARAADMRTVQVCSMASNAPGGVPGGVVTGPLASRKSCERAAKNMRRLSEEHLRRDGAPELTPKEMEEAKAGMDTAYGARYLEECKSQSAKEVDCLAAAKTTRVANDCMLRARLDAQPKVEASEAKIALCKRAHRNMRRLSEQEAGRPPPGHEQPGGLERETADDPDELLEALFVGECKKQPDAEIECVATSVSFQSLEECIQETKKRVGVRTPASGRPSGGP